MGRKRRKEGRTLYSHPGRGRKGESVDITNWKKKGKVNEHPPASQGKKKKGKERGEDGKTLLEARGGGKRKKANSFRGEGGEGKILIFFPGKRGKGINRRKDERGERRENLLSLHLETQLQKKEKEKGRALGRSS